MTLKPSLLLALLAVTFFATARFPVANAFGWNPGPTKVPMGESLSPDPKLKFVDAAPAIGKALNVDSHFKFVDTNSNNNWDPGESVIYDLNNNGFYDPGEVLVAGTALVGSTLKSTSSSSCSPLCRFGLVDKDTSRAHRLRRWKTAHGAQPQRPSGAGYAAFPARRSGIDHLRLAAVASSAFCLS